MATKKALKALATAESGKTAAASAVAEALAILSANPQGTQDHGAAWQAWLTASSAMDQASSAWHAAWQATQATEPSRMSRRASGGRVIHTVGGRAWTEY
jgi:hypothetical protein